MSETISHQRGTIMIIFNTLDSINNDRECAVALGLFDGLHKAHQAVIASAVESGLVPAVFTFTMKASTPESKKHFSPKTSTLNFRQANIKSQQFKLSEQPPLSSNFIKI
jgi:FAD synthase